MYTANTTIIDTTQNTTNNIRLLLRSLGASGTRVGFNYIVFIVSAVLEMPDEHYYMTKWAYPSAAKHFGVKAASVEHAIRTVVESCWDRYDHNTLDHVAGVHLERIPTNSEFIDILVDYLRYRY